MMQRVHSRFNALLSACVLSLIATAGWSQPLTWLGVLPGGSYSVAYGVSDNGVVVGWARNAAGQRRAFRWTASGGMQDLGTLGGNESEARGVSADGRVVVGWADNAAGRRRAFRWENGVMQDLGTLGGSESYAHAVSANGAVVVGTSNGRAFRWQNGVMQNLGTLPGGSWSSASAVSANGAVVVGMAINAAGQYRAFRWENGVMQDLGTLGGSESEALGVSADGRVVVGRAKDATGYHRAFRWENGIMQDLGTLPRGYWSEARGVSADGALVVGYSTGNIGGAVRWTAWGIDELRTTYANLLTNRSDLEVASAISPNGRYIVGVGYNAATRRNEAFLLDTGPRCNGDVNGDGRVDDADLLTVLFNFGNQCP